MKSAKAIFGLSIIVMMAAASPFAIAQATHVRWDIITVDFVARTVDAGGVASATAIDGSTKITMTGSGTFVVPAGGNGTSSAVTGGGTWTTYKGVVVTGAGTYAVTGLVRWDRAPFPPGSSSLPLTDLIEPSAVRTTGLAVLRITYSDGQRGILVVSCTGDEAPTFTFEGITATKGVEVPEGHTAVDYAIPVPPNDRHDGNRTLFHIE